MHIARWIIFAHATSLNASAICTLFCQHEEKVAFWVGKIHVDIHPNIMQTATPNGVNFKCESFDANAEKCVLYL